METHRCIWILSCLIVLSICRKLPRGIQNIRLEPEEHVFPVEGKTFSVHCLMDGDDTGVIPISKFTRNDNSEIKNSTDGHRVVTKTKVGTKERLTITWNPLKLSDIEAQTLSCTAGLYSHSYNVFIIPRRSKPTINIGSKTKLTIAKESDLKLNCIVKSAILEKVRNITIEWRHGENQRKLSTKEGTIVTIYSNRNGSNITIASTLTVKNKEEINKGMYHCVAILKLQTPARSTVNWEVHKTVNITILPSKNQSLTPCKSSTTKFQTWLLLLVSMATILQLL